MTRSSVVLFTLGLIFAAQLGTALAADPPKTAKPAVAPAAPATTTAPVAAPEPPAAPVQKAASAESAATAQCFPECRPGYLCSPTGQCVSRCNPACAEGLECTEQLTCVSTASTMRLRPPHEPPPQPRDTDRPYYHDRFYMQLGLGLAVGGGKADRFTDGSGEVEFFGAGPRLHFAVGSTVTDGLVVGGALETQSFVLRVKDNGDTARAGEADTADLLAFVDWYFMPDKGLHAQLGIGPTFGDLNGDGPYIADQRFEGAGFAALIGVGYEWYVSKRWGIGALFQMQARGLRLESTSTNEEFDLGYASPALLFSATYH